MYTYSLTNGSGVLRSDGSFIPADERNVDYQEFQAWILEGNNPTPATPVNLLPEKAQVALDKSDITVLRCVSASVAVPSAWQTYRTALRAIVNGTDKTSTSLPVTPSFPIGS